MIKKFLKFKMPRYFIAAFFLCISLIPAHATERYGGTYVTAAIGEPNNLIPMLATDNASQSIVSDVFSGLLKYNPDIELEGDLAERWEILNEGKTIRFYLRKNVYWHDSMPFTTKDVEFTYQTLIDPETPTPYAGDYQKVDTFTVIDDYTFEVSYKEAFSPALASWAMWIIPEHLFRGEDLLKTRLARNPVGTGPYRFKRWVTGEKVELIAFKDYFKGRPNLDRIVFRVIPDQTTMFLELHQETIDIMSLTPLQYTKQSNSAFFKNNFKKFRYPGFGYTYLGFNLKSEFFKDKRIRQAINLAIDQNEIIDGVFLGLAKVTTGPFVQDSWAYNQNVKPLATDPVQAKQLLKDAGWQDQDGNGVLEKDGKEFAFTIILNQGNAQRQQAAEMIQAWLKDIGIKVHLRILEWSAFLKTVVTEREFDAVVLGWGLNRDPDPYDIWHSDKIAPGGFNFIHYNNPTIDSLIEQGRRTFDIEERKEVYHAIHEILYEEQPYVFLYAGDATPILHHRFEPVEATAIGLKYNFNDWMVHSSKRKYTRFEL